MGVARSSAKWLTKDGEFAGYGIPPRPMWVAEHLINTNGSSPRQLQGPLPWFPADVITPTQCLILLSAMNIPNRSENEETETETNKTKVSDSGYSNSCSNSQSQRSSSSKSRHSTSSGSSGYCGHPSSTLCSSGDENQKKKKSKGQGTGTATAEVIEEIRNSEASFTPPRPADKTVVKKTTPACVDPAVLDNMSSPTIESEALQVGVLAQTLYCIHSKASEQSLEDQDMTNPPQTVKEESYNTEMSISDFKEEMKQEKEFCIVVSLSDGTVVCSTPSLSKVLGFPKDMWIGRSLINFLHPKDRIAFASHITTAMAQSHIKQKAYVINPTEKSEESNYFYCWMRLYNGLKTSGFNVTEKKATYIPCQLSMNFKEVPDQGVFLVATARIVKSSYKVPGENRTNPPTFTIRHTATTQISHVDNEVVSHFGYLPHDMIGRSIFDFYHAEDLPYLKDVYTNVVMEEGQLFLSRPYKFRCQNGDCVMVETEWSSFINPWGKKLEFIIGRHRVLTGPQNPDVVSPVIDADNFYNEDEQNNSKVFQEEIKALLTEPIFRCYEPSKQQLAQLVESLEKISSSQLKDQSPGIPVPVPSAASEMLGEISPHHVYSDSKSSSETPSYNQLTYNENIQRFFASEPKTAGSNETQDPKIERNQSSSSGGEENKSLPQDSSLISNSDSCQNGSSGISSDNARLDRAKLVLNVKAKEPEPPPAEINNITQHREYNLNPLTEEMLYQHNENMNKQMALKHKKGRSKGQVNRKHNKNIRHKMVEEIDQDDQGGHGTKRSGSHSWEGEPMKAFKGVHVEQAALLQESSHIRLHPVPPTLPPGVVGVRGVWPATPFSTAPPVQPIPPHLNYTSPLVNPIVQLPCVYVNPLAPGPPPPTPPPHPVLNQPPRPVEHPGPPLGMPRPPLQVPVASPYLTHQVQYMPSLMYQLPLVPMVYTQSHIVQTTIKPRMTYVPNIAQVPSSMSQQPSSGATSVKGEPGSALCSFASASLVQGLSDSSKKGNKSLASSPVYSPGGFTSNTGKTKNGSFDNDLTHDDTSYCSYSSLFPKTEQSYDSMKDSTDKGQDEQYKVWRKTRVSESSTAIRTVRKEPSWMENVNVTPELMLRYQLGGCILSQVLQSDFESLLKLNQPEMVNEQLDQLYVDLEGLSKQFTLEESFPSSSSSDEKATAAIPSTSTTPVVKQRKKKRFMGHDRCAMIFEEDAPMPPTTAEMLAVESS